ncbi:MAG TPA: hypothetical protein DEA71_20415 [Nitrospira sp.]|nr:hypothetical protein [Nitrospira sp.]
MATEKAPNSNKEDETARLRLQMAVEGRRFEISLFWQRSLFFWGFNAAALVGIGSSTLGSRPEIALAIACFGFICSLTWTLANRGSKYWHEAWEQKVQREEQLVIGPLYAQEEEREDKGAWLSARRYSVSRLAMALADYVLFLWLCLASYEIAVVFKWHGLDTYREIGVGLFVLASVGFAIGIIVRGRSGPARFRSREA